MINRIYHYTPTGTRKSHPSVHDLQSTTRLAEQMSQIMDRRMRFPCPFQSVVIDYFSPTPLFSINNQILMSFYFFKAQPHDAAAYGNVMPIATLWRHRWCLAPPSWRLICPFPCIFGTALSTVGENVLHDILTWALGPDPASVRWGERWPALSSVWTGKDTGNINFYRSLKHM